MSTLSASQSALYLTNCSSKAAALTDLLSSFALVDAIPLHPERRAHDQRVGGLRETKIKILFSMVSLLLFVAPSAGADFTYQEYTKAPELWKRGFVFGISGYMSAVAQPDEEAPYPVLTPYIPVWDMSQREDGTFSRADFTFDKEHNVYLCPAGKLLTTTGNVHDGRTILYRASTQDCGHVLSSRNVLLI
jgi:hypothetical protein